MPLDGRKTGSRVPETTKLAAVAYYRQYGSLKLTAEKYGLSIGTLATALKNHTTLGEVSCPVSRPRKGRSSRVDEAGIALIRQLLEENPGMYLKDIKKRLEDQLKIQVDTSNICRQMKKARISRKALAAADPLQREQIERQEAEQMRQQQLQRAQQELERRYEARNRRLALQRTPEQAQAAHDAAVEAAQLRQARGGSDSNSLRDSMTHANQVAALSVQHHASEEEGSIDTVPETMLDGHHVDRETLASLHLGDLHTAHHPHLNLAHALVLDNPEDADSEALAAREREEAALMQSTYDSAMADFGTPSLDRRNDTHGMASTHGRRKRNAQAMGSQAAASSLELAQMQAHMHHHLISDDNALMQDHLGDAYYTGSSHPFVTAFDAADMRQLQAEGMAEDDEDEVSKYAGLQLQHATLAIDPNMDNLDD